MSRRLLSTLVRKYSGDATVANANEKNIAKNSRLGKIFKVPEKYKGTFIDKWATYWRDLFQDYADVVKDVGTEIRQKPWKGVALITVFGSTTYCVKNNPNMNSFRATTLTYANDFIFVGPPIRNPKAKEHLQLIERCYNEDRLRLFSFGLFSIIWIDNFGKSLGLYKTSCSYLKPKWLSFHTRILDVGFLDKWWIIEKKMIDFDINPAEWDDQETEIEKK